MAQPPGPAPSPRAAPPPRLSRGDPGSPGSRTLPGAGSARRRGPRRELPGLPGLPGPAQEQCGGGAGGAAGGGLCLEPREHAWMLAAAEGRFEELQGLLEADPGLLLRGDPITGYTLLHWLAKHGRHEELIVVHDLARRWGLPLDMSAAGSGGFTPLHLAALQGHHMVIKVLVGALGPDPTRRDYSGHRACHYLPRNTSRGLRELSGAEDWEQEHDCDNANNNSNGTASWIPRRTLSAAGAMAVDTNTRRAAPPARANDTRDSRLPQIHGLFRHLFPFFQDR
ncbi:ankyrin repeat domain-containing protein SOWAHD [Ctenodactylus gundi]